MFDNKGQVSSQDPRSTAQQVAISHGVEHLKPYILLQLMFLIYHKYFRVEENAYQTHFLCLMAKRQHLTRDFVLSLFNKTTQMGLRSIYSSS